MATKRTYKKGYSSKNLCLTNVDAEEGLPKSGKHFLRIDKKGFIVNKNLTAGTFGHAYAIQVGVPMIQCFYNNICTFGVHVCGSTNAMLRYIYSDVGYKHSLSAIKNYSSGKWSHCDIYRFLVLYSWYQYRLRLLGYKCTITLYELLTIDFREHPDFLPKLTENQQHTLK